MKPIHVQQPQQPIQSERSSSSLDKDGNLRSQTNNAVQDKE